MPRLWEVYVFVLVAWPLAKQAIREVNYYRYQRSRVAPYPPPPMPPNPGLHFLYFIETRLADSISLGISVAVFATLYCLWRLHDMGDLTFSNPNIQPSDLPNLAIALTVLLAIDSVHVLLGPTSILHVQYPPQNQPLAHRALSALQTLLWDRSLREAIGVSALLAILHILTNIRIG